MSERSADCWAPDHNGEMRTTHDHFEDRCVVEPMEPAFRERVEAYLTGGWEKWREVKQAQREGGAAPNPVDVPTSNPDPTGPKPPESD